VEVHAHRLLEDVDLSQHNLLVNLELVELVCDMDALVDEELIGCALVHDQLLAGDDGNPFLIFTCF
jgi:hypothetical protein